MEQASSILKHIRKITIIKSLFIFPSSFENPDNEKEGELDIKESILEGKILNQLIHQIPSENIPQTNFKVKKKTNWWAPIILTIESMILVISLAYIIFFCMVWLCRDTIGLLAKIGPKPYYYTIFHFNSWVGWLHNFWS